MNLVRSDSPEVKRSIASARACACWNCHTPGFACAASALALLIALTISFTISLRAAAWVSLPIFLGLNGHVFWRAISSRRMWVVIGCADQLYIRLFGWRGNPGGVHDPDVLVLDGAEIASMSTKILEIFLDGPKPKFVEWLKIEPASGIEQDIRLLLKSLDPEKAVLVADEGRITIEWKWWRPTLHVFLQQVAQECPSIVIRHEERSELDLNGVWRGLSRNMRKSLDAQDREKLIQARRLGFGCKCAALLGRY
ncbi:MAG TPA: hypothetical protein VHM90_22865, partial [Phycisphaerae bacterium]|nr:hypothetical protein [Phycisphaerae bacterium]